MRVSSYAPRRFSTQNSAITRRSVSSTYACLRHMAWLCENALHRSPPSVNVHRDRMCPSAMARRASAHMHRDLSDSRMGRAGARFILVHNSTMPAQKPMPSLPEIVCSFAELYVGVRHTGISVAEYLEEQGKNKSRELRALMLADMRRTDDERCARGRLT
ncbi:hypothetical protein WJX84_008122 [Apatococcus fuscideae]|uniref:Uncharacterized protein n=1 Tax=Apatococcus fuscideae TaxID=2026836 RepID=A0AAW1T6N1_9CHLO